MSRIGKQPISLPEGVTLNMEGRRVKVIGPKGELALDLPEAIEVVEKEGQFLVVRHRQDQKTRANHGTIRSLIENMIIGVTKGWEKELEVVGTGYRVDLQGEKLVLRVGFSHLVEIESPEGIKFEVADNKIKILGSDKELVGNLAARIRKTRPPDPYKGKGVRYLGEEIKLKPGKAAKVGAAGGGE